MKSIRVEHISKSFNGEGILEKVSLTIPAGKFFALLGPSGCGKTTLLRLIGGFEVPDSGSIFLGDVDITHLPINQRKTNTVFQDYALFPHLTVFENVAYSLVVKGERPAIIKEKVMKMLKIVHLELHADKMVTQLSGGQKQRIALVRAIINEPEVLLLDEPLAALDVKLREKMLLELIELQEKFKTTFVYVTHDQFEALTVADQMAIMNYDGVIEQIGTPKAIYEFPATVFVAQFVGTTNIFRGMLTNVQEQSFIEIANLGLFEVDLRDAKLSLEQKGGVEVFMSIRPEKFFITRKPVEGFTNHVNGVVESIVYHGRSTQYNVRLKNAQLLQVFEQNEEHFPQDIIDYDHQVYLYWQKENATVLDR